MSGHQNLATFRGAWQLRPRSARRAASLPADLRCEGESVGPDRAAGGARGGVASDLGSTDEARIARAEHRVELE